MRPKPCAREDAAAWEVVRPRRPSRVPGVSMAGFGVPSLAALRMVPHPAVTLAVDFGSGLPVVEDAAGRQQRGGFVAGLGCGFQGAVLLRGENVDGVQVRIAPLAARAVLGVCPDDLGGAVVTLADLWGREASRIRERLGEVSSWEERFALTDLLLARRGAASSPVDPEVARAWELIVAAGGLVRVEGLAAEVGWSRKRLWSRFHSQIGLPPKRAARLVRFDQAAHRLAAGRDAARVAADGGYTDQSHLHRDVRAFTGVTPAALAGEAWLEVDDRAWPDPGHPPGPHHSRPRPASPLPSARRGGPS